ncbi:MAG TPA: TonB-dependent receptor [Elusimicrobiota bacterium]|nr:TonB-dependent receptor [Elusimicrobiota bacterium]
MSGAAGKRIFSGLAALWLGAAPLWAADSVFISVTRTDESMDRLPSNISVVTKEEIAQSGAKTLAEVLETQPAMDVNKTGSLGTFSTLRMRGVPASSQVQVLVDDRPLGGTSLQFIDLSQIPVENIERIEIVRGASSVLYGANTIGGVVHVITKRHTASKTESYVGVEGGSFRTQVYRAGLGMNKRGFDANVDASRYWTDGFQKNADADNIGVSGNGGYTFKNGARIALDAGHSNHEVGDPQGTLVSPSEWDGSRERDAANTKARTEQDINSGRLQLALPLGAVGHLQSIFYGSDQDYRTFPDRWTEKADFDQNNRVVGNDTRFFLPVGFLAGASYQRDRQESESVYSARTAHHVVDWAVYAQQRLTVGRLDLIPAARWDQNGNFGNIVNPRFTAVFRVTDGWDLSANAARSFRAPSFLELFYEGTSFTGNKDLRPETGWTYDVGVRYRRPESAVVRVTGFYTRIRERIAATSKTYENLPQAELAGAEFEAEGRFGPFTKRVNYTYQRAVGNSAGSTRFKPLTLTPRHAANLQLIWAMKRGWSLANGVRFVDRQFQNATDFVGGVSSPRHIVLPSYTLWNVRLTKRLLGAELFFAVENITNKHYAEAVGSYSDPVTFDSTSTLFPQPGRTLRGGIVIRFLD